jgi:uncharacterized membrane protein YtjA (UPF0391 family)
MLRAAIIFFVLALVALLFGLSHLAGVSLAAGKILLLVFVVLAVISYLVSLGKGGHAPPQP